MDDSENKGSIGQGEEMKEAIIRDEKRERVALVQVSLQLGRGSDPHNDGAAPPCGHSKHCALRSQVTVTPETAAYDTCQSSCTLLKKLQNRLYQNFMSSSIP